MKKLLGCFLCVMLLCFLSTPVVADTIPYDTEIGFTTLGNYGETNVTNWLTGVVGGDPGAIIKPDGINIDDKSITGKAISEYDPGFGWTYAVVHIGGGQPNTGPALFAYLDMPSGTTIPPGDDNILNVAGEYLLGVSFIRFYGPHSVPEPATLLLLGTGLVVLAGFGRKKFKS